MNQSPSERLAQMADENPTVARALHNYEGDDDAGRLMAVIDALSAGQEPPVSSSLIAKSHLLNPHTARLAERWREILRDEWMSEDHKIAALFEAMKTERSRRATHRRRAGQFNSAVRTVRTAERLATRGAARAKAVANRSAARMNRIMRVLGK